MHPSQISDLLVEYFPTVGQFSTQLQHSYAGLMLSLAAQSGKKHTRAGVNGIPDKAMALYCRAIDKKLGPGGFNLANEVCDCVGHSSNWSVENGETKAYWLTLSGNRLIEDARQRAKAGKKNLLLDHNGASIRKRSNAVYTARDNRGNNAVTDADLTWAVPINLEAINLVLDVGVEHIFPNAEPGRIARTDSSLRAIHACALNDNIGRGLLPQTYHEVESGRLYGFGGLSLQNVTREAKTVALLGAIEYDFENCQYRLLNNVAIQHGLDAPVIAEYVNDTRGFRQRLADELGITYKQAKGCLLATLFGATPSTWPENAIPMLIGEKASEFYALPMHDALSFEILEVGDWMRTNAERTRSGAIVNSRDKSCLGNPRQELAHLLQGMEAELLHQMIAVYGSEMLIIQHDGFTLSGYQDPRDIEAAISYTSGFEMPVTWERLSIPEI